MERVDAKCGNSWDLKSFLSLLQNCQKIILEQVDVLDNLGPQTWAK